MKNSSPVKDWGKAISPGKYPTNEKISSWYLSGSLSLIKHFPLSGLENPIRCLMVVLFPAPLGPRKPKQSPLLILNDISKTPRLCP